MVLQSGRVYNLHFLQLRVSVAKCDQLRSLVLLQVKVYKYIPQYAYALRLGRLSFQRISEESNGGPFLCLLSVRLRYHINRVDISNSAGQLRR